MAQAALAVLPLVVSLAVLPTPAHATVTTPLHNKKYHALCLDADTDPHGGSNPVDRGGMWVQLWTCSGGDNQKWIIDGNNQFRSVRNHMCLDADNSHGPRNGMIIKLWPCSGQPNQEWDTNGVCTCYLTPYGSDSNHKKVLDANIAGPNVGRNGMRVQAYDQTAPPGLNQQWTFN
jgi:hypothetical protein